MHPQTRHGKDIVRRATIAVLKSTGNGEIELVTFQKLLLFRKLFLSIVVSFRVGLNVYIYCV